MKYINPKHLVRRAWRVVLAISIAAGILATHTSIAWAGHLDCLPDGRPRYWVDVPDLPNESIDLYVNGEYQATIETDANGQVSHPFGQPYVQYNVEIEWRGSRSAVGDIKCEPTKPTGSQGQTTPDSWTTYGNTYGNSGTSSDPIATGAGEYFFDIPLFDLGELIPLRFTLSYAANMDKSPGIHNDPFSGDNFTHSFHIALQRVDDTSILIFKDAGNLITFERPDETWQVVNEEVIYQLQETARSYYLLDPLRELIYIFDKASIYDQKVGLLTYIMDRNGNMLMFSNDDGGRVSRIEDGLGNSLDFNYQDPSAEWIWHHLASVIDQGGRTVQFDYQVLDDDVMAVHLAGVTDPMDNTISFSYTEDPLENVVSGITYPKGNTPYTQTYERGPEDIWRVVTQTDAYGNTTTLNYDDATGLTTITDPLGHVVQHTHAGQMRLMNLADAIGNDAILGYDENGRRVSLTDRLEDTTSVIYHTETGKITSLTNARGDTLTLSYEPQQQTLIAPGTDEEVSFIFYNLTQVTYFDDSNETFAFDERGNLSVWTEQNGEAWGYEYNDRGQLIQATNPVGGDSVYTFNESGTLASKSTSDTGTTSYSYDEYMRLVQITYPDGNSYAITYNAMDRMTTLTDENGLTTSLTYDDNGNLLQIMDPTGATIEYEYDLLDRFVAITDRLGNTSERGLDALGRVETLCDPTGVLIEFGYDPRGWLNQTNMSGQVWTIGYNDDGIPTDFNKPSGSTTVSQSNELGFLTVLTDPLGESWHLTRDALNRVTGVTDPLDRSTTYEYDERGLLTSITLPDGGSATYDYDDMGSLSTIHDLNEKMWTFDRTPMGWLATMSDPLGNTWDFAYDERGQLAQVAYPDDTTLIYTQDAVGNLLSIQYSDGTELQYDYDELYHLIGGEGVALSRDAEGHVIETEISGSNYNASYDGAGRLTSVSYADGAITVHYLYDPETGLLTEVSDSLTGASVEFSYNEDFQLVDMTRSNGVDSHYTWDAAGRLNGIQDGDILNLQLTLDAAGQVVGKLLDVPLNPAETLQSGEYTYSYDDASQLTGDGYTYDALGRLTTTPNQSYTWDVVSRLIGITTSGTDQMIELTYNDFNNIQTRREGNQIISYAYNYALGLDPIVAEKNDATGQFLRYYVWTPGGQLLYMIDAGKEDSVHFYHFDQVGSTLALTDANGNLTDAYAYDPYGVLLAHQGQNEQPFTFVGAWGVRQEGSDGNLYHMRARYYDANLGRFLSREPIWPVLDQPKELNPYVYASVNPLSYIDLEGTKAKNILRKIGIDFAAPDMDEIMNSPVKGPLDFAAKFVYISANPYELAMFITKEGYKEYTQSAEGITGLDQEYLQKEAQKYAQERARWENEQEKLRAHFLPIGESIWRDSIGYRESVQKTMGMQKVQGVWIRMRDKWIFLQPIKPGMFQMHQNTGIFWIAVNYQGERQTMMIEGVQQVKPGYVYIKP